MCLVIFEEKAEVQDQYPLSLNPDQKANDQRLTEPRIFVQFQLNLDCLGASSKILGLIVL